MRLKAVTPFIVAAIVLAAPAHANDPLQRRIQFGLMVEPNLGGGLKVLAVSPGLTGAAAGMREGDVLLSVEGTATDHPATLLQLSERHRAGEVLRLEVRRDGSEMHIEGMAAPRPRESYPNARVEYGAVGLLGGQLRTIFAVPNGVTDGPVLYMMQGHPCASAEALQPDDPTRAFIGEMLARGIAVYRIEKSGVGDSMGGPRCQDGGFDLEFAGFQAGWTDLTTNLGIKSERIYLFGHSMGGVDAALIAAAHEDAPPRGIIVYGTVLQNFHDYLFDLLRLQSFLMTGEDPVQANATAERSRAVLYRLILQNAEPVDLISEMGPEATAALAELGWDGSAMMGHPVQYWRDLAQLDLVAAWRDSHSHVLSLYGASDLTALNNEDAITIVDVVNHYRSGTARYVELQADHLMSVAPPRAEAIGNAAANAPMLGKAPPRPFNPEIARVVGEWITTTLASPSVYAIRAERHSKLWFDDATAQLPPATARNGMAVVPADLDDDGDLDLVIPQEFSLNKLLMNDGSARFAEISSRLPPLDAAEISPPGPPAHDTEDAAVADYDMNGIQDIVFVSEDDFARLGRSPSHEYYQGLPGGSFRRVLGCLPDSAANGVAAADITGDGWMDLLLVGEGQDRLLINDRRGCFRDETAARLPEETGTGQDSRFVDVDGDHDLDLVVGYEGGHALWINNGDGHFRDETSRLPQVGNVEARKIATGDVDGDGDIDLYFAHVGWQGRSPQDQLFLNNGEGHFTDETGSLLPAELDTTLSAVFGDFDADGDLDLATVGSELRILANDGAGRFTDVSAEALPGRIAGPLVGLAAADLNGDGAVDLYGSMLSRGPEGASANDWMLINRLASR